MRGRDRSARGRSGGGSERRRAQAQNLEAGEDAPGASADGGIQSLLVDAEGLRGWAGWGRLLIEWMRCVGCDWGSACVVRRRPFKRVSIVVGIAEVVEDG